MKPTWDQYFMNLAIIASTKASCDRKHVGCVLVKNKRILATGFNGSIEGTEECDDVGHMMENGHCIRTIHAEINAIIQCAKYGISCKNSSIYINTFPCWSCFKVLANSGIKEIYYKDDYRIDQKIIDYSNLLGITLQKLL